MLMGYNNVRPRAGGYILRVNSKSRTHPHSCISPCEPTNLYTLYSHYVQKRSLSRLISSTSFHNARKFDEMNVGGESADAMLLLLLLYILC